MYVWGFGCLVLLVCDVWYCCVVWVVDGLALVGCFDLFCVWQFVAVCRLRLMSPFDTWFFGCLIDCCVYGLGGFEVGFWILRFCFCCGWCLCLRVTVGLG